MDVVTIDHNKFKLKTKLFKKFTKGKIYKICSQRYFRCTFRVVGIVSCDYRHSVNIEVLDGEYLVVNDRWIKVNPLNKSIIIQCNKRIRYSPKDGSNMDCVNGGINLYVLAKIIGIDYNFPRLFSIGKITWKKNK